MDSQQDTILVVDDNPANLGLLFDALERAGYRVLINTRGDSALDVAAEVLPDLILLDVMMPGIDGFETCRRLKQNVKTRTIPVIFMTALTEVVDEVKGLELGAVDYIAKPIQIERVLARISTHLTIRKLQRQLELQNSELNAFAHTVAHDLKSPLGNLVTYTEYLEQAGLQLSPEELAELGGGLKISAKKAVYIVDELLLLASVRKEHVNIASLDMAVIVKQALQRVELLMKENKGEVTVPAQWPAARGYGPWVEEVWVNYLSNGLKYGGQPPQLELGAEVGAGDMVRFWVKDSGPGIAPAAQANLFTEFTRLDQLRVQGHGLGLSIVRRIVQKLEGQVGVDSCLGQGSTFYFTLPAAKR